MPDPADDAWRRGQGSFFGRRAGRPLRDGQAGAMATILPALRLDLAAPAPANSTALFPVPVDAVRLEIGFGGGEHLLARAGAEPNIGFIGVEPFESGMAKAVTRIAAEGLANIRLFDDDAALVLDWLPPAALAEAALLFPDPWPKKRHWKRRFVSPANLARLARALSPGAPFRFASDVPDYVDWTRTMLAGNDWTLTHDAPAPWPHWPGTRYEAKARRAGRPPHFLEAQR